MKFNHLMALAAAALAVAAPANAAVVFSQGDLLMGFHANDGQGVGQTYVVNLGSAATFRDATGTLTLNLGNIGADLTAIYGANWSTRTDLSWGIAASPSNVDTINGDPSKTMYASRAETTTGELSQAWQITSSTTRTSTSTRMQGLYAGFQGATETVNSAFATIQADSAPNGWRSYMNGGANAPGAIDFGGFSDIEGTPSQTLDLFRVTTGAEGSYEGSFSISNGGIVTFSQVPEASASLLAGAGALLLAVRRRRNNA